MTQKLNKTETSIDKAISAIKSNEYYATNGVRTDTRRHRVYVYGSRYTKAAQTYQNKTGTVYTSENEWDFTCGTEYKGYFQIVN